MKANNVDIIDVMIAVHRGELKIVIQNGFFLLENTRSGERVRLNETDAAPVVHGRWIEVRGRYICSECKSRASLHSGGIGQNLSHYCPNCGARMDGDGNA